jgi:predicted DNA-binding transcriptional regulator YafY
MLNREKVTAKELAEKFEVSVRTIYRDIDTIDLAGIPIISFPGNNGGYGIMENYKLNNQLLTMNNIYSLLTTLKAVNTSLNDIEIDISIEKLRNLIPDNQSNKLELHLEQLVIDMPAWAKTDNINQMIKDIRKIINESRIITIMYEDINNKLTSRQIEPMTIIFKGYTWHLFAYCRLKKDYRVFRVSRINKIKLEDEYFTRRNQSYTDFDYESKSNENSKSITIKFDAVVKTRVKDIFKKDQIDYLESGDMIVTANFPDQEWYLTLILSFGHHAEVISPEDIRDKLRSMAQSMYEKYL